MALLRSRSSSSRLVLVTLAAATALLYYFRASLQSAWVIADTPVVWDHSSDDFLISSAKDNFDLTFANYSRQSDTSLPEYPDLVPPVLHHIALGSSKLKASWVDARESCLEYHEGWDSYLWTDANAPQFVQEHFPEMKKTWDGYKFPIQRIDALRYMVLYHYGGMVISDLFSYPPVHC
jgi:mannosyltransferase OCH1-like enzyme